MGIIHKMWQRAQTVENPLRKRYQFVKKISKKVLDKEGVLWYYSQARLRDTAGGAKRTLKTIQRETRKKFSEDSKRVKHESVERIKRKSLILAQDERWRRA